MTRLESHRRLREHFLLAVLLLFPDNDGVEGVKGAKVLFPCWTPPRLSLAPHEAEGETCTEPPCSSEGGEVGMVELREAGQ